MQNNKKYLIIGSVLIVLVAIVVLVVVGSSQSIADIKNEKHLGQQVKVSGVVTDVIKIGQLSGYALADKNGEKIAVSANKLPKAGDKVVAQGTLTKEILIGYFIQTKE